MACELSFGLWLKQRRKALDLTQDALATHDMITKMPKEPILS
jgi:hypothetical protein